MIFKVDIYCELLYFKVVKRFKNFVRYESSN